MNDPRIVRIEVGTLEGTRPRPAGSNARLGKHGSVVRVPLARITTEDGWTGFGRCAAARERLAPLVGLRWREAFLPGGPADAWLPCEFPLWDLAAKRAGLPVYALAAAMADAPADGALRVPCYDTSLYFDDLHLESDAEAAALIAAEAREGMDRGHRAFKIKIGRGARHMPLDAGMRRDAAIIRAVRAAVGPDARIMVDANNGFNLNLTKWLLEETADVGLFWLEEAFHEDPVLYGDLKEWLAARGLDILIADGEGQAAPGLLDWARDGLVDVVQYDIFGHGFGRWLATGRQLDSWEVRTAPHHYGAHYGNYATCHLATAIRGFLFVEWDEVATPGLDASGYRIEEGVVVVPNAPGFGLGLDDERFLHAVGAAGFTLGE
ncbi:MAG: enolase C-terminal domain-like protein [Thermomicrobiales bacterium]